MLLTFLYHRINNKKYSNSEKFFEKQFYYFSKKYKTCLPGDSLKFFKINLSITFDDGYFDFYHYIYPLLKKYNIKATLAISVKNIKEKTNLNSKNLNFKKRLLNNDFCTWDEIKEMSDSGYVKIANHSFSHKNLLEKNIDLDKEIIFSKKIIEKKINKKVDTFIYPYGKFNKKIHVFIKNHYKYIMRIGSSINLNWNNFNKIIYRIPSDDLKKIDEKLKLKNFIFYICKFFLNTLRGK